MTTSIVTRIITKLLTQTDAIAWRAVYTGQEGRERLLRAEQSPLWLERLYTAMQAAGEALEAFAEATAARIGIDMADVLEPLIAARMA
ncbi:MULTISPECIES: hypothetical protein [unclassified Bradyrhizobium]|uniref:hypothetical protein n=1 Tax=unclassified Bradyrhizobium TaxID=2631580 RepID=UPI0029168747|nr:MULTISPECIES: hypothetical protein [unclassified Bradyrhizobium]